MVDKKVLNGILAILLISVLVGCTVKAYAKVGARFEDDNLKSGSATDLIVKVENTASTTIKGKFVVIPENSRVQVQQDERVYEIRPEEDSGERHIKINAVVDSEYQKYRIDVQFVEEGTNLMLGKTDLLLKVSK